MGTTYSILVRPIGDVTGDELLADATRICGKQFENYDEMKYEMSAPSGPLMLNLDNVWDEECDPIPYHLFPWEFLKDNGKGLESMVIVFNLMRDLYTGLVATGRYQCMFVQDDTETIIASNAPGHETGSVEELHLPDAAKTWIERLWPPPPDRTPVRKTYAVYVRPVADQTVEGLLADAQSDRERFVSSGDGVFRLDTLGSGPLVLQVGVHRGKKLDPDGSVPSNIFPWKFTFSWELMEYDRWRSRQRKRLAFRLMAGLYWQLIRVGHYHCMFVQDDSGKIIISNVPGHEIGTIEEINSPDAFERW